MLLGPVSFLRGLIYAEIISADLDLREGNLLTAKALLQKCLRSAWRNSAELVSYGLERLANRSRWDGVHAIFVTASLRLAVWKFRSDAVTKVRYTRWDETTFDWTWSIVYIAHAKKTQQGLDLHKSLSFLAQVFHSTGEDETAESLFIVALEGFTYMDIHQGKANCMLYLGDIFKNRGDLGRAAELWKGARELFERSLQTKSVAEIDSRSD
ncbi:hypothetical protein DFH07DRAFT_776353 [Mycena maculata]|uniref:Uncharacterized protein n=1 Tax=Mycena maculata TaxID=230809 RepID=A0AAD7N5I2_9AGAR|nr:hypothetical protein DFH07DRAFT_776353 [Mycena maculata]